MLVWKSHLDQHHGCGNGEAKNAMVDHRVGLLCRKVVDQQVQMMIHENIISITLKMNHPHMTKTIHCHLWLLLIANFGYSLHYKYYDR